MRCARMPVGVALAAAALALVPGCAKAFDVGSILDAAKRRLGPEILTYDVLAAPGEEVTLKASLRSGLRLEGMEGKRLRFTRGQERLAEVRTDGDGNATVAWTAPKARADVAFTVSLHPDDQPDEGKQAKDATLLVAVRPKDEPLAIVDLDKTVVASSFFRVLTGGAKPMRGSQDVLRRLKKTHTIVYLTHRPDFLGPLSKGWLQEHKFVEGPLLTSSLTGLLEGSGSFKTERIQSLRQSHPNVKVGIGDKFSDAEAYVDNGIQSILILPVTWSDDDPEHFEDLARKLGDTSDAVHVVDSWAEVEAVLFEGKAFPKARMIERLRARASALRTARAAERDDDDEDEDDD